MSMTASGTKFRVAICGGGIGGLTFAVALSKCSDIQTDIYEAATEFAEIGAGVGIWRRTWQIIKALGLDQELSAVVDGSTDDVPRRAFEFRKSDQQQGINFVNLTVPFGVVFCHRTHFQQILAKRIPSSSSHFSKRFVSYTQSDEGPITLAFSDGSTAVCDVLVGADGIKSAVRANFLRDKAALEPNTHKRAALENCIDPIWSGTVVYRSLLDRERLAAMIPGHRAETLSWIWTGKNSHLVTFPVKQGRTININAFSSQPEKEGTKYDGLWVQDAALEDVLKIYDEWEPEAINLLHCASRFSRWAIHTVRPLPFYTSGRVALLGDAAHAMTPHAGSGGGQAIEDGYILAKLLCHPLTTIDNVHEALRVYEAIRLPIAHDVVEKSRSLGQLFEFSSPIGSWSDPAKLQELGKEIIETKKWLWEYDIHEECVQAYSMLAEKLKK